MSGQDTLTGIQRVSKPTAIRNLGEVDHSAPLALLAKLPERYWQIEDSYKENQFAVFHSTQHIVFRFIEGFRDPRCFYSNPSWKLFQHQLLPVMQEIANRYEYQAPEFPKVMLARLFAGEKIDRHTDNGTSNAYVHKIHVPLVTSDRVDFFERNERFNLRSGFAYEVNNLIPHGVVNNSDNDRIHLVFEMFNQQQ